MPTRNKLIPTGFRCPECKGDCFYNIDINLFVCARKLTTVNGDMDASCGKFYLNREKYKS